MTFCAALGAHSLHSFVFQHYPKASHHDEIRWRFYHLELDQSAAIADVRPVLENNIGNASALPIRCKCRSQDVVTDTGWKTIHRHINHWSAHAFQRYDLVGE